jgi:adenylate cyclase
VSIRTSLLLSFGLILAIFAGGVAFNNIHVGRRIQQRFLATFINQTAGLTETKAKGFLQPAARLCSFLGLLAESDLLDLSRPEGLVQMADALLRDLPIVSSLNLGTTEGWGLLVRNDGTNWLTRVVDAQNAPGVVHWTRWDARIRPARQWTETLNYDPRQRPWFRNAMAAFRRGRMEKAHQLPRVVWTAPYTFRATGEAGLTTSVAVRARGPHGPATLVIACDVLLRDLDEFTRTHPPTPNGWTIIIDDAGRVVGRPFQVAGDVASADQLVVERQRVTDAPLPRLAAVARAWMAQDQPADYLAKLREGNETFWFSARPINVRGTRFWALMIIPERDVMADILWERKILAGVLAGVFLVALGLVLFLASAYSRPVRTLVRRSEAIQRLELNDGPPPEDTHIRELHRLFQAQANMRNALASFSRYVPVGVIRELLKQRKAARIGARPAELTILFSDIRGFTRISEQMAPDALAGLLSEYFGALQEVIEKRQGTTDKFIGDAVLAFWGAPAADEAHARHAVEAVLECRHVLARLNRQWEEQGRPRLETCFGLATGPVVVGNVGAPTRMNYTVLGNTVNVASRLEHLCREVGCDALATETVVQAAGKELLWRRVGPVAVRGKKEIIEVFEPLGRTNEVEAELREFKRAYETALARFLEGDFTLAEVGLEPWRNTHPAARALVKRCRALAALSPPPARLLVAGTTEAAAPSEE